MKTFLFKLLYFVAPVMLLALPLDFGFSYLLSKSSKYRGELEVWNDIYRSNIQCDYAIYGSSRAWVHFDPSILKDSLNCNAYNFGMDGHNFWLQYLRHRELIKHNAMPRNIIISVDVFSLQKREDLFQSEQFLPFMLWRKPIYNFTKCYAGYSRYDYYIPLVRYAGKTDALKTIFSAFPKPSGSEKYRQQGFRAMKREWTADLDNALTTMQEYQVQIHEESVALFEQFIKECKQLNINLILVYAPEYIEGQKFVSNRQPVMELYYNLAQQYDLIFLDYSMDEISFNKSLFYNSLHLNETGAVKFSRKLASDLKNLEF